MFSKKNGRPRGPERAVSNQPFSPNSIEKVAAHARRNKVHSVCPYCAVGCGQLIYVKGGKVIDIEGNPDSPINAGTLCPKGANTFQLHQSASDTNR